MIDELFGLVNGARFFEILIQGVGPAPGGKYRHWDTLRRMQPPEGLTMEEWWLAQKLARTQMRRWIPLKDKGGTAFHYTLPDPLLMMLHRIDREASGHIQLPEPVTNPETRDRYIQNSLMEEAITSSQLEGAAATRDVAKEMIRTGRPPVSVGERMIINNYRAMQAISQIKGEQLTPELIIHLHRTITEGTLEPSDGSYLRKFGDGVGVYDDASNLLLHSPPSALELTDRMQSICAFANEDDSDTFLHPVLKAIILHFWLAYDHPFVDGNGRTARALFYWSMLSKGFWLFEFVSISTILRKAPAKYGRSFLYTETDDNDLTYFILSQLRVICQAVDQLYAYLQKKAQEIRKTSELLRQSILLNYRQLALLSHALRHPGMRYTIESHRVSHRITYQTARADLLGLVEKGLLEKRKRSKAFVFTPVPNLTVQLQHLS